MFPVFDSILGEKLHVERPSIVWMQTYHGPDGAYRMVCQILLDIGGTLRTVCSIRVTLVCECSRTGSLRRCSGDALTHGDAATPIQIAGRPEVA